MLHGYKKLYSLDRKIAYTLAKDVETRFDITNFELVR